MAQTPLFYQSNYLRVVQPNSSLKLDTLINPFTGGMNNPTFFNIDLNGDGLKDMFVFDREQQENQFLLFTAVKKNSIVYHFAPQFESAFPNDLSFWAYLADFNKDGLPDIFTHSPTNSTGIKVYKNTSYFNGQNKYILQFKAYQDTLFYADSLDRLHEIDVPLNSNPCFVDVDRDGFIDILSLDINLNNVQYFRSQGKYKDSLKFYFTKKCWGYFEESGKHLYTPWNCERNGAYTGQWDPKYHKTALHGYSSIFAMDIDGDKDLDLLVGDGGNDSLGMLRNGWQKHHKDTIDNITYSYNNNNFPVDQPAIIPSMPTPSGLDVNNDGLTDLIVAAGMPTDTDTYHKARVNNIWYYQNDGDSVSPVFRLHAQDFLQSTTIDWGISSAPCFVDVDHDGRKDLIVAVRDGGGKRGTSHAILYLNKAGAPGHKPYLLYQTNDYMNLSIFTVPIKRPVPAAYLNGKDGKTDIVMGNDSGRVMYFKDKSTGAAAADFKMVQSALLYKTGTTMLPIDVGYNSAPTSFDVNKDGMTDLLIGANNGAISYYRCLGYTGPDNIPYFTLVTNTFGGINATPGSDYQSAPCVADLDRNGKPDLLVGDRFGRLLYYPDFDTVSTLVASAQSLVYDYRTGARSTGKLFSTYVIPAVANLDQDTLPDIVLGCRRGGLFFLGSVNNGFEVLGNSGIEEAQNLVPVQMKLFPNPARDFFTLGYNNGNIVQQAAVSVIDMFGREVIRKPFNLEHGTNNLTVSTGVLQNGIYIVNVIAGGQMVTSQKIIINK